MREIKFRGKRTDNGEWVFGDLMHPYDVYRILSYEYSHNDIGLCIDNVFDVESESVGQYTGLKDKNGKEIYEGDIVRNKWGGIGVVVLHRGCLSIKWNEDEIHFLFEEIEDDIEIIGNIIDNEDLLNEK